MYIELYKSYKELITHTTPSTRHFDGITYIILKSHLFKILDPFISGESSAYYTNKKKRRLVVSKNR